ncbi:hypothetical protein OC842_007425, partial [Tilletia horrida]
MSAPTSIVIGASRGIGEGLVQKLSEAGYKSYGTVRSQPNNDTTFQVDMNDADAASMKAAAAKIDSLDVLIVNGAIASNESYLTLSPDRHREFYQTNVVGPLTAVQAFLPALQKGKHKTIVFLSSLVSSSPLQIRNARAPADEKAPLTKGPYSASKAALNFLGIGLYDELAEQGFSLLAFHPGLVRTDMAAGMIKKLEGMNITDPAFQPITVDQSASGIISAVRAHIAEGKSDLRFLNYDGSEMQL